MGTYNVDILLSAKNSTGAVFSQVQKQASALSASLQKTGTMMQLAGFRASAAMSLPATAFVRSLVTTGKAYSQAQNELQAVVESSILEPFKDKRGLEATAALKDELGLLADQAERLSAVSKFDAVEVTNAQKYLGMAGLGSQQVLGATGSTVTAATGLNMDVATVADKLTNTALGFGFNFETQDEVKKATTEIADLMAYTAANANVSGEQMFESMKSLGPLAVATGQDIQDMASMLAVLGNRGIQGAEAGVALRSSIARMLAPTKQVRSALKSLNIDMAEFTTVKDAPTTDKLFASIVGGGAATEAQLSKVKASIDSIMGDSTISAMDKMGAAQEAITNGLKLKGVDATNMGDAVGDYTASVIDNFDFQKFLAALAAKDPSAGTVSEIFGKYHYSKILSLMQGINESFDFERMMRDSGVVDGAALRMMEVQMQGLYGELERLRAAWVLLLADLTNNGGGEAITSIVRGIRRMMQMFVELSPAAKVIALRLAMISVALGPLLIYVGMIVQSVGALAGVFSWLGRVLIGLPLRGAAVMFGALAGAITGLPLALLTVGAAATAIGLGAFVRLRESVAAATDQFGVNSTKIIAWEQAIIGIKNNLSRAFSAFLSGDGESMRVATVLLKVYAENLRKLTGDLLGIVAQAAGEGLFGSERFAKLKAAISDITQDIVNAFGNARAAVEGFFQGFSGGGDFGRISDKVSEFIGGIIDGAADAVIALGELFSIKPDADGWLAWGKTVGETIRSALFVEADPDANDPRGTRKKDSDPLGLKALGVTMEAIQVGTMVALSNAMKMLSVSSGGLVAKVLSLVGAMGGWAVVLAKFAGKTAMLWALSEAILAVYNSLDQIKSVGDIANVLKDAFSSPAEIGALGVAFAYAFRKPLIAMFARLGMLLISPAWATAGGAAATLFAGAFKIATKAIGFLGNILYTLTDPKAWAKAGAKAGSIFNTAMAAVGAVFKVAKIVAVGVWRAAGALAMLTFQTAMWAGKALFTVAKVVGTGVFNVAGTMAGALFSAAFRLAMAGLKAASLIGGLAWRAAGLAAGALWGAGFKGASALSNIGPAIAASMGGSITNTAVGKTGGWGRTILRFLGRGLLRAIPLIGLGLLAYDIGRMIWDNFSVEILAIMDKIKEWFREKLTAALKVAEDLKASLSETFSAVGDAIANAIKAPFETIVDFYAGKLKAIIDMARKAGQYLGLLSADPDAPIKAPKLALGALERGILGQGGDGMGVTAEPTGESSMPTGLQWGGMFPNQGGVPEARELPQTLSEQGFDTSISDAVSGNTELLKQISGMLSGGLVKASIDGKAQVDVRLTAPAGMGAVSTTRNTGDVQVSLNTGSDPTGPF